MNSLLIYSKDEPLLRVQSKDFDIKIFDVENFCFRS